MALRDWVKSLSAVISRRGLTSQLFFIVVLPVTILLLIVAFGSQSLHHYAMHTLVGDRDLRFARSSAQSLSEELKERATLLQFIAKQTANTTNPNSVFESPLIISHFDRGLALFDSNGEPVTVVKSGTDGEISNSKLSTELKTLAGKKPNESIFLDPIDLPDSNNKVMVIAVPSGDGLLTGAFSLQSLFIDALRTSTAEDSMGIFIVAGKQNNAGPLEILYKAGSPSGHIDIVSTASTEQVLKGESGIDYEQHSGEEFIVAFSPVPDTRWGLVTVEAWTDIDSTYLRITETAPLVLVPALLLALGLIWFGVQSIIKPLQELEKQTRDLITGDQEVICKPVGGIREIQLLQQALISMVEQLAAAQKSLHNYIGAMTTAMEAERHNLARELHDDTIQALVALNQRIQLGLLKATNPIMKSALEELQQLIQQTITNLRRTIGGLRPIYLEDLGLITAVEMLANESSQLKGIPIAVHTEGEIRRFKPEQELMLYRMIQEGLNNVTRHADAQRSGVEFTFSPQKVSVIVWDDGQGFILLSTPGDYAKQGHFGLLGLHERAELIGASLRIDSSPGKGTRLIIELADSN